MAIPAEFKKLTDPTIPLQTGTVALNDLVHTVDVSDTDGGAAGTSKRTTIQKISDTIIGEIITPDLQEVTDAGNTTTNDINLDESAVIFNSGSKLKNGTLDNGFGGGISQECSNNYEQEWENGVQYHFPLNTGLPDGAVYANSINGQVPDQYLDRTKGYIIGSRYRLLNTGYEYLCLDNTENAAVWELVINADWDAVSGPQEILNKPTIPAAQVNSDWNATSGVEEILNKPTIPPTIVESVTSGTNINVDNTDPSNPIINSLADRYKTSSTTSNTIGNGSKNFTVDLDLAYIPLQEILVVYNPSNHMHGEVTSYNAATGALVVDIKSHTGSGTYTSWVLNLDGTPVDAITGSGTANEISYFTAARVIASLPVATYPSLTELSYVKGVTSAIQTQLNAKVGSTRNIGTTAPLSGGGDLSSDRTISIADAAADGTTKGAATFTAADFNSSSGLISIDYTNGQSANTTTKGFLTSTDWNTFNNKQAALVSGTNIKTINNTSILGSGNYNTPFELVVAASDETTALTTGTGKITFRMPRAVTLTAVRASLTTAQASGSIFTVDINEAGTSILSTKITINNTDKTSTSATIQPVISDVDLGDDSEMTIDIDQIGNGTAKGLKVYLIGSIRI